MFLENVLAKTFRILEIKATIHEENVKFVDLVAKIGRRYSRERFEIFEFSKNALSSFK